MNGHLISPPGILCCAGDRFRGHFFTLFLVVDVLQQQDDDDDFQPEKDGLPGKRPTTTSLGIAVAESGVPTIELKQLLWTVHILNCSNVH